METFVRQALPLLWMLPITIALWWFWWAERHWSRWLLLAMATLGSLIILFTLAVIYYTWSIGCYSAPKEVPFHQGMMLCPGQSARIDLRLQEPK